MQGILANVADADVVWQMMAPWSPETLTTAPSLFMGVGALLWVPLSLALGRRPVFLLTALIDLLAILGAGCSRTFCQLLGCVCLLGLCEGFALSLVSELYAPCLASSDWCA